MSANPVNLERRASDRRAIVRADNALRTGAVLSAKQLGVQTIRILPYGKYVAVYVGDQPLMMFSDMAAAIRFLDPNDEVQS